MSTVENTEAVEFAKGAPAPAWASVIRAAFDRYDDTLLGEITTRLIKPRTIHSREELVRRSVELYENPVLVDRRIQSLEKPCVALLEIAAKARQNRWYVATLAELVFTLGWQDGIKSVVALVEAGLAFPLFQTKPGAPPSGAQFSNVMHWLANPGPSGHYLVFPDPLIERMHGKESVLPDLFENPLAPAPGAEPGDPAAAPDDDEAGDTSQAAGGSSLPAFPGTVADGCEWFIRMSVLWQKTLKNPLRRTQAGDYFKKDQERLEDPQIAAPVPDAGVDLPDIGYWLAGAAVSAGVFEVVDTELRPTQFLTNWQPSLVQSAAAVLKCCFEPGSWNPQDGWKPPPPGEPLSHPFPSVFALAWSFVARLEPKAWIHPGVIEAWILRRHPWWSGSGVRPSRKKPFLETWLLGIVWPLGLLEKTRGTDGRTLVRLSPQGRKYASGEIDGDEFRQIARMLIVQPNLEVMVFRQGLDPQRIAKLSRFATWKTIGPACVLQLGPETVYRALELGDTFESIRSFLDGHATRAVPGAVIDQLRSWASKHERVVVHSSALVLEFANAADLDLALSRGLLAVRLGERHALVDQEEDIDFRLFRLAGSRDYLIAPEPCIHQNQDGLELSVDDTKSDLLLETELPLVADPLPAPPGKIGRSFRVTPASLNRVKERGWNMEQLDQWFRMRTGEPARATIRLFFLSKVQEPFSIEPEIVLYAPDTETADGLWQWQKFRPCVRSRLGPLALSLKTDQIPLAEQLLNEIGLKYKLQMP